MQQGDVQAELKVAVHLQAAGAHLVPLLAVGAPLAPPRAAHPLHREHLVKPAAQLQVTG